MTLIPQNETGPWITWSEIPAYLYVVMLVVAGIWITNLISPANAGLLDGTVRFLMAGTVVIVVHLLSALATSITRRTLGVILPVTRLGGAIVAMVLSGYYVLIT